MSVLPWVTGLTLAGILPLLFTRVLNQQAENHDSTSITAMLKLRQARLGVNGCIISGIVLDSRYGLMPLYLNHKGVSNASIGFWMAVLVSAGILDNGRLDVWRISLVDCWCCVFRSLSSFSAVSRCLARRRWPLRYSSRCRWLYAISGGDGLGL